MEFTCAGLDGVGLMLGVSSSFSRNRLKENQSISIARIIFSQPRVGNRNLNTFSIHVVMSHMSTPWQIYKLLQAVNAGKRIGILNKMNMTSLITVTSSSSSSVLQLNLTLLLIPKSYEGHVRMQLNLSFTCHHARCGRCRLYIVQSTPNVLPLSVDLLTPRRMWSTLFPSTLPTSITSSFIRHHTVAIRNAQRQHSRHLAFAASVPYSAGHSFAVAPHARDEYRNRRPVCISSLLSVILRTPSRRKRLIPLRIFIVCSNFTFDQTLRIEREKKNIKKLLAIKWKRFVICDKEKTLFNGWKWNIVLWRETLFDFHEQFPGWMGSNASDSGDQSPVWMIDFRPRIRPLWM